MRGNPSSDLSPVSCLLVSSPSPFPEPAMLLTALALLAAPADVSVTKTDTDVEFHAGPELVAKYRYAGTVQVDKGTATKPLAKPFVWPLNAPGGVPVTRPWPMVRGTAGETTDHFHQKSVWFCHGDVIPDGVTLKSKSADKRVHGVDFWAEGGNHGRIVCTRADVSGSGVVTANEWRSADGDVLLTEARTVSLTVLPAGHLLTFDIELTAANGPVTFGDTKEGSMGVRVPDGWVLKDNPAGGVVTSSDGATATAPAKDNLPMWGKPADWHDYSGTTAGKAAGLAVFDHPSNPHRANWHTRAYGLMAANPFGRGDSAFPAVKGRTDVVKLAKGERLKLKYGVYAHTGDATTGKVAEAFAGWGK
jgi:hypothetical protein